MEPAWHFTKRYKSRSLSTTATKLRMMALIRVGLNIDHDTGG